MQQPGLRVQPGGAGVVGDLHLDAVLVEPVQRPTLGRARVRRREQADGDPSGSCFLQRRAEQVQACPADERDHGVDPIGARQFGEERVDEGRLAGCVGQQIVVEEGQVRQGGRDLAVQEVGVHGPKDGRAPESLGVHVHDAVRERGQQAVRQLDLQRRPLLLRHRLEVAPDRTGKVLAEPQRGLARVEIRELGLGIGRGEAPLDRGRQQQLVGAKGERISHHVSIARA